jgi:hypothetical protein
MPHPLFHTQTSRPNSHASRYQWLKLEDIRSGIFVEQCRLHFRRRRQIGEKTPRYVKLLQGALLFAALLLCIWLPLLLFSSGAPTYQTPAIQAASVNATLGLVNQR